MLFAKNNSGRRIKARRNVQAVCPLCCGRVIAKCGAINVHHWAHETTADCDPWWEHETQWHRYWKSLVPPGNVEVSRAGHRADIVRADGTVVELQHSSISVADIAAREAAYGNMVWLFDGRTLVHPDVPQLSIRDRGDHVTFRWYHPRKHYAYCRAPVYIDLGRDFGLLRLRKLYLDGPPLWRLGHHRIARTLYQVACREHPLFERERREKNCLRRCGLCVSIPILKLLEPEMCRPKKGRAFRAFVFGVEHLLLMNGSK